MEQNVKLSFEVFPSKGAEVSENLKNIIRGLAAFEPEFISITCGAGGKSKLANTVQAVEFATTQAKLNVSAHLTILNGSKAEIKEILDHYHTLGVKRILALRGDSASGIGAPFTPLADGYQSSLELVQAIAKDYDFNIAIAAYPEKHPDSLTYQAELDYLRQKIDAGATHAITQFFFDNHIFERYLERVTKAGLKIELIPGLMPIHNFNNIEKFARATDTSIPESLYRDFDGITPDSEENDALALKLLSNQAENLLTLGLTKHLHIYTLNRLNGLDAFYHLLKSNINY